MMFLCLCILYSVALLDGAPIEKVIVDLTYPFDEYTKGYPNFYNWKKTIIMNGTFGDSGAWVLAEEISGITHQGTHMDAPSHFGLGGLHVDQIPESHLIAPVAVINIVKKAEENPNAEVLVEDLEAWERTTGQTLDEKIILVNSGWGQKWYNKTAYFGTPDDDATNLHFPSIGPDAAQWLVDSRNIYGVGVDSLSLDIGSSRTFTTHKILLGANLFGLENVANVDKIPIYGAMLYVMPMKVAEGSGAPTRIVATFPKVIFDH